jgi:alpha-L-rhamnosidase
MDAFSKSSKWIRQPGLCAGGWRAKVQAAPFLRREFDLDAAPRDAKVLICGIGYYELHLNGGKVGDHVLDPGVTQFDKRVRYVVYDVSKLLKKGRNVLGVVLGNGWYNSHTPEVWHFDKAAWRDYPKMRLQLEIAGKPVLFSDEAWKASSGPILFDGLRNGETYDARLELDGWLSPGYDDSAWKSCERVNPPGGVLQEQTMPPCKVMESFQPVGSWRIDNSTVFDFGKGLSGWCKIRVKGEAGSLLQIVYGERLSLPDGGVDQAKISPHVLVEKWHFQTDRYTLKGGGEESWEPRFTYHGFQYAQIFADGEAEILSCEARFVHTAFETVGEFSCSDETLNRLHDCARLSYKGNFVGIPTDCPHREKNGWTGDAQLAVETGLHNFAPPAPTTNGWTPSRTSSGLAASFPDSPQRGWGFNWGSGPAWDSAFHIIAWNVHLFDGNDYAIKTHYEALKRYVDYCESMADDNIVSFGLGDWAHVDRKRIVDVSLTSTGYYFTVAKLMIEFAKIAGRADDVAYYEKLSRDIKNSFNAKFHKGDGLTPTARRPPKAAPSTWASSKTP